MNASVIDVPQFGALILRVPLMEFIAEGENALFGAALFLVATCATESGIEFILIERGKQRLSFH